MASDGRRKMLITGVRDKIKAATGGPNYFYNWSLAGVCELGREADESFYQSKHQIIARVYEGGDRHIYKGSANFSADLEIQVDLRVRGTTPLVAQLNDAIADITLAVRVGNPSVGVCATILGIDTIDPPIYDFDQSRGYFAQTIIRILGQYDYTAGVDR